MATVLTRGKLKPPEPLKPMVERAFELARSGECTFEDIERTLGLEGYPKNSPHWNSGSLRKQLRTTCRQARAALSAPASPEPADPSPRATPD